MDFVSLELHVHVHEVLLRGGHWRKGAWRHAHEVGVVVGVVDVAVVEGHEGGHGADGRRHGRRRRRRFQLVLQAVRVLLLLGRAPLLRATVLEPYLHLQENINWLAPGRQANRGIIVLKVSVCRDIPRLS